MKHVAVIPDILKEAVGQSFCTAQLGAGEGVRTVMNDAVKYLIIEQIRTAMLEGTIDEQDDNFIEAGEAAENGEERPLCNNKLLSPTPSLVRTKSIELIMDQQRVHVMGPMSMAPKCQERHHQGSRGPLCARGTDSHEFQKLRRAVLQMLPLMWNLPLYLQSPHQNEKNKSSESDYKVSLSDSNSRRKAGPDRRVERLDISESNFDKLSQKDRYETYDQDKALKAIHFTKDLYKA